ncbi:MAG: DnaJ family domain-containing protein [Rubrivivax sp.]|jgi:hypothetical protein
MNDPAPAAPKPQTPAASREEREQRLKLLEDHIGQHLQASESAGELQRAPSWGRPLDFGDGYAQTPDALKMPMKILKDAGVVPAEVEAMQAIAALQEVLNQQTAAGASEAALRALRQQIAERRQALALRLEHLRLSGSL